MADLVLPDDYAALLGDMKAQIRTGQTRAALSVNRELVLLLECPPKTGR